MKAKSLPALFIFILIFLISGFLFWEMSRSYRASLRVPINESQASENSFSEKESPYLLDEVLVKFTPGVRKEEIPEIIDSLLKDEKTYQIPSNTSDFYPLNRVKAIEITQCFPPTKTLQELEKEIKTRFPNTPLSELEKEGISAKRAYEIQMDLARWYKIKFSGKTDPQIIANNLLKDDRIEEAVPNYKASAF